MDRILSLLLILGTLALADHGPIIDTNSGQIQGMYTENGAAFYGVPYAQPPLGPLRWAPPKPKAKWNGVLNTTTMAEICYQPAPPGPMKRQNIPMSEDCLYLNVWVPYGAENVPVMVWFHGGGWNIGTPNSYPGDILAANQSVIVVTVAYRLGVMGFMTLPELLDGPLNFGMLDQQLSLLWVQENIHNFGGDPSRVTIFGESAGGGSVGLHLLMKESWKYYNHAIMESPGTWKFLTAKEASAASLEYAAQFGCTGTKVLACMRAKDPQTITPPKVDLPNMLVFQPVVDGNQLTDTPFSLFLAGKFNQVPILIGSNKVEGNSMALLLWGLLPQVPVTDEQYNSALNRTFGEENVATISLWYSDVRQNNGTWHAFAEIMGDFLVDCGAFLAARAIAKNTKSQVYRYYFTHIPVNWPLAFLNCTHLAELAYVFNNPHANYMSSFTEAEIPFSYGVSSLWGAFARQGKPNDSWPTYTSPQYPVVELDIPLNLDVVALEKPICEHWIPYFL